MSTSPVPIFDPQGVLRDVPPDQLAAAVKAGGMPAVKFLAPDKSMRFVPANRTQEAYQAGGTIQRFEDQDIKHPGFWASLIDDARGIAEGSAKTGMHVVQAIEGDDSLPLAEDVKNAASTIHQGWQDRTKAGEGIPYRVGAAANEALGVNVKGEEQSAAEGDVGGVAGHAAAVPATMAATSAAGGLLHARLASAFTAEPEAFVPAKATPAKVSVPLDATEENVDYAGAKPAKAPRWDAHDATGENKSFAGGLDEWNTKLAKTRPLSDLSSQAVGQAQAQAQAAPAPQPAPEPPPQAAPKPAAKAVTKPAVKPSAPAVKASGDPILDRLRQIAADIKAKGFPSTDAEPDENPEPSDLEKDLTPLLLESLKQAQARKAIAVQ